MLSELAKAGLLALEDYVVYHVLTCLIPAFLLAGGMVAFISKETMIRYLGHAVRKIYSFTLAAGGSFFLAACSCTVLPVSSGLYYQGCGIGPAFILLWVAPAANILALTYTGAILGAEMAIARIIAVLAMAFIVGVVMVNVFRKDEMERARAGAKAAHASNPGSTEAAMEGQLVSKKDIVLLLLIVASLLGPNYLVIKGPYIKKIFVWAAFMIVTGIYAIKIKSLEEIKLWLKETLWFIRIIFPLMLGGVFAVGVIGKILPPEWIQTWLGGSGILPSFLATVIGSLSYFATMTEAPFVDKLMSLGMGKGPALALLMTGPGLSLPNILAAMRIFGVKKAGVYAITIVILGTLAGWIAGNVIF